MKRMLTCILTVVSFISVLQASEIYYTIATHEHAKGAIECITENFCLKEPISKALKITKDEFRPFVELFTNRSIASGQTIVAWTPTDGVIGCLVAEDFALDAPLGWDKLHSKLDSVFDILGRLEDAYKKSRHVEKNQILHILMVGVFSKFSGLNIGKNLILFAERVAKRLGYFGLISDLTSPVTQHIFKKLDYEIVGTISYKEFSYKGSHLYSDITDCSSCDLAYKTIK